MENEKKEDGSIVLPTDLRTEFIDSVLSTLIKVSNRMGKIVDELQLRADGALIEEEEEDEEADSFWDDEEEPEYVVEMNTLMEAYKTLSETVIEK